MRVSIRSRQFTNLDSAAGLEVRIAVQQRFCSIQAISAHSDIPAEVSRDRGRCPALPRANAITYSAPAFEKSILLKLSDVWFPDNVVGVGVIVHEKDILVHIDLPGQNQTARAPTFRIVDARD